MSFLYNPMNSFNQTIPNYFNPQSRVVGGQYGGEVYRQQQESLVQFKVFAYEKLNHFTGRNPSAVIRFELFQNRTFTDFLNVLKNHSIAVNSYKFSYLDDEHDLIVLSTENDFRYMIKLMKGKTITIVCEKIPQVSNPVFSNPRVSNENPFRNLPFFMQPSFETRQEQEGNESLIEKALESVFNGIFEKKQETPQRMQCMFPRAKQEEQADSRIGTIRLLDLLKQNVEESQKAQEEKKQEASAPRVRIVKLSDLLKNEQVAQKEKKEKQEKETKSFEDFLAELFGKKLAERKSQEAKQEEQPKNEANEKKETLTEQSAETNQKIEHDESEEEKQAVLSTSQIISNYLLDNEDDETDEEEEEYDESDDQSSEISEQVNQEDVQYPTSENYSLQTNEANQQFEKELKLLSDMGFNETNENIRLLNKYNGDIQRAVSDLIYYY